MVQRWTGQGTDVQSGWQELCAMGEEAPEYLLWESMPGVPKGIWDRA